MAVITSASSGNFSAPTTWVGGVVPGAGDDAVAATTHVVTIDVDVTVLSFQQAGTGKFVLGNGRTVTGNVIANAGTFASGGTIECTSTTSATINGNLTGVSSTVSNIAGVVITGTGTLTVNGNTTGSAGNNTSEATASSMIYTNIACTLNVNGAVTGGTGQYKRCVQGGASANMVVNVTGNTLGGQPFSHGISVAGPTATLNILGNVTGGQDSFGAYFTGASAVGSVTGNLSATSGNSSTAVYFTGLSAQVTVTGNITGGTTATGVGLRADGNSAILTVVGNVAGNTGGSSHGIFIPNNTSLTITGQVSGGAGGSSNGVQAQGTNSITVTGPVTGGLGASTIGINATSGSSTVNVVGSASARSGFRYAIRSDATSNGVIFQGDMTDAVDGTVAVWCRIFRMTQTAGGVTKYASGPNNPFGSLVSRVDAANSVGMPATTNVRSGTVYGTSSGFTGTVAIPSAGQTMYGVLVDGTTGTAVFDLQQVADIVELQVSAGAYERTTL